VYPELMRSALCVLLGSTTRSTTGSVIPPVGSAQVQPRSFERPSPSNVAMRTLLSVTPRVGFSLDW
jgi:hypothetical protein